MNRTVIALGFFDGVHRGHGALLEKTAARARELETVPAAFTFDRPPKEVVTGRPVGLINTPDDRRDLMQRLYGIRQVIIAPFDRAMMTMPWQDFIDDLLIGTLARCTWWQATTITSATGTRGTRTNSCPAAGSGASAVTSSLR